MNLKSCNKVETNRYQLEVEVDEQSFNDALNRTYHKEIKKISLPGFRKGKPLDLSLKNITVSKYSTRVL